MSDLRTKLIEAIHQVREKYCDDDPDADYNPDEYIDEYEAAIADAALEVFQAEQVLINEQYLEEAQAKYNSFSTEQRELLKAILKVASSCVTQVRHDFGDGKVFYCTSVNYTEMLVTIGQLIAQREAALHIENEVLHRLIHDRYQLVDALQEENKNKFDALMHSQSEHRKDAKRYAEAIEDREFQIDNQCQRITELEAELKEAGEQLTQRVQGLAIWTKVEDGLPEEEFTDDGSASEPVLLEYIDLFGDLQIEKLFTLGHTWYFYDSGRRLNLTKLKPIQWAPIPQPPKPDQQ